MRIAGLTTPPAARYRRQRGLVVGAVGQNWAALAEGRTLGKPGPTQAPISKGPRCLTKSPRQTMTKKSGKSLKEKRAAKRGKTAQVSQTEALLHTKKH